MKQGSAPNFCPPVEEGISFTFEDEKGDLLNLEFLGLVLLNEARYGFFVPTAEDDAGEYAGEVIVLEVTGLDEDGQPDGFELVDDAAVAQEAYRAFQEATKDLYDFA